MWHTRDTGLDGFFTRWHSCYTQDTLAYSSAVVESSLENLAKDEIFSHRIHAIVLNWKHAGIRIPVESNHHRKSNVGDQIL
jgi:hypothetical protein